MIPETQLSQLFKWYAFRDRDEVLAFLDRYPAVAAALVSIYSQLMAIFPDARISLQIVHDHETTEQDKLVAFISTSADTDEDAQHAVRTLLEFIAQWRRSVPIIVQQQLGLNLELQSQPRESVV